MSTQNQRRKPEEIETDIYQSRARLDDTLHELEERFSPQNLVNAAFDYVRQGGANEIMANVGKTVKRNPLPVMLTGIGLGWFMLSQRNAKREQTDSMNLPVRQSDTTTVPVTLNDAAPTQTTAQPSTPQPRSVGASATDPGTTGTGTPGAGTTGAGTTSTGTDPASVGASATPSPATPQVSDYSSHSEQGRMAGSKEKARHMTDQVKGRSQNMTGRLRDRASQARTGSRSAMRNMGTRAQGAGEQATHFIQDHPLMAGAIGVAIGAALGSLFPTSRIENERMGSVRDRAMHKATETGQEQLNRAQQQVHEQADKVQQRVHEKAEEAKSGSSSSSESDSRQNTGAAGSSSTSGSSSASGTGSTSASSGNDHPPTRGG